MENTLEQQIKHLSTQYNNPSEEIQKEMNKLKTQLENIIHKKTQFLNQQLKYENLNYGNKSSKLLANLLQYKKERAILNSSGDITWDPQEINYVFHQFYNNLYSSDHKPN